MAIPDQELWRHQPGRLLTILGEGDGSTEDLTIDLDDTANAASSTTGIHETRYGAGTQSSDNATFAGFPENPCSPFSVTSVVHASVPLFRTKHIVGAEIRRA
jgi:hypothetical protein